MKKDAYPKVIADRLGIPAFAGVGGPWMSNEGTVLKEWVRAVSEALDVPYTNKVSTMKAMVEAVGEIWDPTTMASEGTRSGGGGNISTEAFRALLHGLETQAAAGRRGSLNGYRVPFNASPPDAAEDRKELRAVRVRRGQPAFRAALLIAYDGRCAVTDCDAVATLEAAHIIPYGQGGTYATSNGLLLRADVHTLFDLLLLTFDTASNSVILHPELRGTTYDKELSNRSLALPKRTRDHPLSAALDDHRKRSGL